MSLKTTLIIARHGNTFEPEQTPTRVGAHTDLPLTEGGRQQGRRLARAMEDEGIIPDVVYAARLKRSYQTAQEAVAAMPVEPAILTEEIFDEIDYGPDENKTEDEVVARIGQSAIDQWNQKAIVPEGWQVSPEGIIGNWQEFADKICRDYPGGAVLVVTSNGIARFAPHLTGDFDKFASDHEIKLSTGAYAIFETSEDEDLWTLQKWNVKPGQQTI